MGTYQYFHHRLRPPPTDTTIVPGVDPAIANTIGFFLDDWTARTFTPPSYDWRISSCKC